MLRDIGRRDIERNMEDGTLNNIKSIGFKESQEISNELHTAYSTDLIRLRMIAKRWAKVAKTITHEDLLHEAMLKAIEGSRRCPKDLDVVTFLAGIMRSLASNYVKRSNRRKKALGNEVLLYENDDYDHLIATTTDDTVRSGEDELLHAEHEKEFRAFLEEQCKGCEKTLRVLRGGFDGLKGQDLCDFADVTKNELATIHRRIKRTMDRFEKGRI